MSCSGRKWRSSIRRRLLSMGVQKLLLSHELGYSSSKAFKRKDSCLFDTPPAKALSTSVEITIYFSWRKQHILPSTLTRRTSNLLRMAGGAPLPIPVPDSKEVILSIADLKEAASKKLPTSARGNHFCITHCSTSLAIFFPLKNTSLQFLR